MPIKKHVLSKGLKPEQEFAVLASPKDLTEAQKKDRANGLKNMKRWWNQLLDAIFPPGVPSPSKKAREIAEKATEEKKSEPEAPASDRKLRERVFAIFYA